MLLHVTSELSLLNEQNDHWIVSNVRGQLREKDFYSDFAS